jgi:hypothetical protein
MSDPINWQEQAEKFMAWANENQAQADEYLRALTLACDDMPGDTKVLVSTYIALARKQIAAKKAAK